MQRDQIDFGKTNVSKLFVGQLVPTLLGMISTALFIITDGIFVGRGIGSDALAAINIAAPLSLLAIGIGLMFGMGGAIVASINLSRGKIRVANINATQTLIMAFLITSLIAIIVGVAPGQFSSWMGAEGRLIPLASEYLFWYTVFLVFNVISTAMPFFVRISSPKFAMWTLLLGATLNIVLDYLFIFIFGWGLKGAAWATGAGMISSSCLFIWFLLDKRSIIRLQRFKTSWKSIRLTLRNTGYIMRLGFSSLLSEATLALMMLTGNYVFIEYLGPDGVAAYSIICYIFPVFFMLFNGIIQSAQPIISFNYGTGDSQRYNKTYSLALMTALSASIILTILMMVYSRGITGMFVTDLQSDTALYANAGLPVFAIDLVFFAFNIISIGYYMSIEKTGRAVMITALRGILPVITFFTLPSILGVTGIWLAVPAGEIVTTVFILVNVWYDRKQDKRRTQAADFTLLQA